MVKTNKIGIIDISDKEFEGKLKKAKEVINKFEKEINKIIKEFNKIPAQERLILFDVLLGIFIDNCKLSSFIVASVLQKYLILTFQVEKSIPPELLPEIAKIKDLYIG